MTSKTKLAATDPEMLKKIKLVAAVDLIRYYAITTVELSYEDAIRYLRKEAVNLPADTPKGYVLVTYRQVPIGWEKNIGNRANNLYPQEWKIKSSHGTGELFIVNSLQQE